MKLNVAVEEFLPHSIEAVWAALTNAETISGWLMPTVDFQPVVGARFRMRTEHLAPGGFVDAEVVELEPPRRMVWSWSIGDGSAPTTVTFALHPEVGGTRVRLTHIGEIDPTIGDLLGSGWPGRLKLLREVAR